MRLLLLSALLCMFFWACNRDPEPEVPIITKTCTDSLECNFVNPTCSEIFGHPDNEIFSWCPVENANTYVLKLFKPAINYPNGEFIYSLDTIYLANFFKLPLELRKRINNSLYWNVTAYNASDSISRSINYFYQGFDYRDEMVGQYDYVKRYRLDNDNADTVYLGLTSFVLEEFEDYDGPSIKLIFPDSIATVQHKYLWERQLRVWDDNINAFGPYGLWFNLYAEQVSYRDESVGFFDGIGNEKIFWFIAYIDEKKYLFTN